MAGTGLILIASISILSLVRYFSVRRYGTLADCLVYHDAAHVKPLTKDDLAEFFDRYISPVSSSRSKLSIHLRAQGKTPAAAGTAVEKATTVPEDESKVSTGTTQEAVVIEDVRDFKARLNVSAGARPVKDLSEFEDLDAKL